MGKKNENNDPNKLKPEEYNVYQMLNTATAFLNAAKRCNEPSFQQLGWSHPLLVPIVTNVALSCELFLKTILRENNASKKEHNLLKLFESLPEGTRRDIIGSNNYQDFISKLNQNSCLFQEWRYIYEYHLRSLNISFLFDFAERLSNYVERLV